ncbi:UvrD-helicase domain-containing protein [Flavobacterium psychrophilum]|uniref:DNA 3'-5' helicase n=5 Tax=Flavobacterium psychrophilum TaxID=96345 RepID=A6GXZ5_FLAPJ|nr:UvrD-helicase domain-containing protein [Flavobacterium psychrophilum]AIG29695.1 ATP-dependent DNA helicase [Flavobacterium psychrophilum]AIG31972.1 ATP-dependent DNA helicase [Flavobacterium psychrophilum]AIG34127.1 ATP-dependent DNA helicase [Flavobacterium psychrophilum]AIG36490.1 ATP-dependent DNA helicase [Flavobacterium psychrophilum]AIG38755.1 ATP-dependent DNA helicase [Flavobacterium psychrophilum]
MQKYISQLNEAQQAPVLQKDGPMIVIAGAGSGKTRVLTVRIANLMSQNVDAFNILALTFTNKAAREMKKRIADIVGNAEAKNLWMGTFHSVFARILRSEADKLGYPSNFTIYDAQDSVRLLGAIIKEMQLDKDIYKPKQVFSKISSYKNSLVTVKAYFNNPELQESDAMAKKPRLGEIYQQYVERCFKAGAMDFDDLLLKTNELLTRFPEVLLKYQDRFRYILVDEYQDTNHSQYLIVRALSDRFQNICVVGDDAQSIYGFRGANINNILNFQKDYENVKMFRLEQNYRSSKNIVEAANSVIDKNKTKLDKVVWTANDFGQKIKVNRSVTDNDEGRFVAGEIWTQKMTNQMTNGQFAILYRTNAQSRAMEDALRKRDIPYRIYGGLSFYQRKEIKDVLCYLRLVINPKDEEALIRVINYPARGIGDTTIEKLTIAANHYKRSIFEVMQVIDKIDLKLNSGTKAKLQDFVTMIKSFQAINETQDAFYLADHVAKKTGYIQELKKDGTPEGIARIENIEELLNGIKDFTDGQVEVDGARGALSEFLEDVALATDLDKDTSDDDRVALMTIHLAKGLEFPTVFVVGMEEDLFPSAMSMSTRSELEEERRLFYVALTRAEHQAYLTYAQSRYRWGKLTDSEPSRFIEEINGEYLEYITPPETNYRYKPQIDHDIFGDVDKSKLRLAKPITGTPPKYIANNEPKLDTNIRKLKPLSNNAGSSSPNLFDNKLVAGNIVMHERFGKGEILNLEGVGADKKAEIKFEVGGIKKLLLRFAKLDVMG